jgi:hypothetical protein
VSLIRVDAYEVFYSSNLLPPRIGLKHAGEFIGQLIFKPNGMPLPPDTNASGQVNLYYHLDDFQNAIDLLRNEKPIYMFFNGTENGIKTMVEKVGEGEITPETK